MELAKILIPRKNRVDNICVVPILGQTLGTIVVTPLMQAVPVDALHKPNASNQAVKRSQFKERDQMSPVDQMYALQMFR